MLLTCTKLVAPADNLAGEAAKRKIIMLQKERAA